MFSSFQALEHPILNAIRALEAFRNTVQGGILVYPKNTVWDGLLLTANARRSTGPSTREE